DLWLAEGFAVRRIDILVRTAVRPRADATAAVPAQAGPRERPAPTMLVQAKTVTEVPRRPANGGPLGGSPVDARCSFDTFCEGNANRLALAAARAVAEGGAASFNPLFIHAGVGRGKSHLLHAIAQASRTGQAGRNVV